MRALNLAGISAVAAASIALVPGAAYGLEQGNVTAALDLSTATLLPVSSVSATVNCPSNKTGDVLVQWSVSTSSFVTGYDVTRSVNGGPATKVASLPATTTSYRDASVAGGTSYQYGVIATFRSWTSLPTTVSAVTAKHC